MKTITHIIVDEEGPWSKRICVRTPPTVPNVVTTHENYTDEIVKGKELRHVNVTWNVTENKNMPYQGLSGFRLQIVSSRSNHTAFLNLSEQFATSLVHNKFSMTLPGKVQLTLMSRTSQWQT
ncbi:uncharacterized protein [Diadema antillarum]|uniref:uncharacterized protein n=1 Tax=Diadema antillarum TaxID=105358 RepID=UPI003A8761C2